MSRVVLDIARLCPILRRARIAVFLEIVNNRYESQKPTVFSTNYNKQEIYEKLGARTHSRLFAKENTVIDMFDYPDLRLSM